ncbi:MAG: pyridoxamine 5'-phosphate oxidase family protein [Pseudomonadales bacterium]
MNVPYGSNPLDLLDEDRGRARDRNDPCATLCTLATVDAAGHPQARTVVLRDLDGRLAVFGNTTSPKWSQMALSASLAVVVWLPSLQVQYRLQCDTRPVPKARISESWQLRRDPPKRLDWFYTRVQPQSSAIEHREALLGGVGGLQLREPLVAPRTAAGVFLEPISVERLDLDMADGIHDRRLFRRQPDGWREIVVVP